ncbi:MAG: hypothetical protein M3R57_08090, partial [Chloroflexota bacterium]|nr:hypothetical protein [Chloroflexota bacterium]
GENPLGPLVERLRNLDRGGSIPTRPWSPDRFRGSLFDVDPANYSGLLPDPDEVGFFDWPWPGLTPDDFVRPEFATPLRVLSATEAAVHGFSNNGGLVKRVYLRGPDRKTLYYFSMWPMLPDESS